MRHHCSEQDSQFQHTAARRRLRYATTSAQMQLLVSTHSRPKAAASLESPTQNGRAMFQHTAARRRLRRNAGCAACSQGFNTQPPEGGCRASSRSSAAPPSFNTQPPEGGCPQAQRWAVQNKVFQHTAARRRLPYR